MKLYSSMRTLQVTNNAKGQEHEITLKLNSDFNRLKRTSHILLMCFFFCFLNYYVRRSVLFKIHAANIEALKFFVCFCR